MESKTEGEESSSRNNSDDISMIPLHFSDLSFSDNKKIKEEKGSIIHFGDYGYETCIFNIEFKEVYYYYYYFIKTKY